MARQMSEINVLLVEDDEDEHVILHDCLLEASNPKFKVDWARDFDSGLEALSSDKYDVCLLDYLLGDGNGLKFSKDGMPPMVTVRGELMQGSPEIGMNGRFCRIEVQDNGIGFEPKYLEKIFTPFQRLHGRGKYKGTGIGLATCRRVAERHGGTITAQSSPGKGSTFIVDLPVKPNDGGESE